MFIRRFLIAIAASVVFATTAFAQDKSILVASTTSTQDFRPVRPSAAAVQGQDGN